jgi:outer membrane protein OmpA-like peptidoglycan-associated protein
MQTIKKMFLNVALFYLILPIAAKANVLGNMQTFAPNPDSLIFQNIHSSQTLEKNYFNVGFFAAYVRNELSVYDNLTNPKFVDYKDKAFTFDFVAAWGVTKNLEVTYSMPGYFKQDPDSGQGNQYFISNGMNGQRLGFKYNISQEPSGGFAFAGSADLSNTTDNPYIGNSPDPIYNAELVYDVKGSDTGYGFNLGYRKRTPGQPVPNAYFLPVSDQLIASAGYVIGLSRPWRLHAEVFGSYGLKKENHPDQTYISSVEVLLGAKRRLLKNFWGHVGATLEALPKGLAPDYRVYLGLNYFFGFGEKEANATDSAKTPLAVSPTSIQLSPKQRQKLTVTGGTAPYHYRLKQNFGSVDEDAVEYVAPARTGQDELTVTDSDGATIEVPVYVRDNATPADLLEVQPTDANVYTGGVVNLKVTGGKKPYVVQTNPPRFGSISTQNFMYKAPLEPGDVRVIIKDRTGQVAETMIHVLPVPNPSKAVVIKNLNFVFNTSRLTPTSQKKLDKNFDSMSQLKIKKIIVAGHTDGIGGADYNQVLSQSRAEAVAKLIRKRFHMREDQVEAIGYGKTQPIATNKTEAGRLTNRRVELKLYYDN